MFAVYVGFGHVLQDTREIPVADPSISYAKLRSISFTDDEIDTHRRAYQFLRSAIMSEVDRGILHRAHSPTEAWRNFKERHNPDTVSATQTLHQRFLSYATSPGQNSLVFLTALEEMAARLSQQNFPMTPDQALLQYLSILLNSEYKVEGGLSLSDESFPNGGARGAFAKPSRGLREAFAERVFEKASRSLQGASTNPSRRLTNPSRRLTNPSRRLNIPKAPRKRLGGFTRPRVHHSSSHDTNI